MDDAVVLEENREARVVPAGDGGLAHRWMLFDRRAKVLFYLGHCAAALRAVDRRVAELNLIIDHEGLGESRAAHRQEQSEQNRGLHGLMPNRWKNRLRTIAPGKICQSHRLPWRTNTVTRVQGLAPP